MLLHPIFLGCLMLPSPREKKTEILKGCSFLLILWGPILDPGEHNSYIYHIRFGNGIHGQQKEPFDLDSTSSKFQAKTHRTKKHVDQKSTMSHFPTKYANIKKTQSFDRALFFLGIVWHLAWYFLVFLRFVLIHHIPPQEGHKVCWRFTLSRNPNRRKLTTLTQGYYIQVVASPLRTSSPNKGDRKISMCGRQWLCATFSCWWPLGACWGWWGCHLLRPVCVHTLWPCLSVLRLLCWGPFPVCLGVLVFHLASGVICLSSSRRFGLFLLCVFPLCGRRFSGLMARNSASYVSSLTLTWDECARWERVL